MNREIKFRVWHPVQFNDNDEPIKFEMSYDWAFEEYAPINDLLNNIGEGCELMQYTGLRDKNGKEIYEGDIIRIHDCECTGHDENESEIWEPCEGNVLFEDGMFVFEGHSAGTLPMSAYKDNFEVIGNIYEHKHLLK